MAEIKIPNLHTFEGAVYLDQDGTLAETDAGLRALYEEVGKGMVSRLLDERKTQRRASYLAAQKEKKPVGAPYDLRDHLGPNPSFELEGDPYGLTEQEIVDLAARVREKRRSFLYPDARRLLGRLALRGITPTILTYGDPFTQNIKAVLNGLDYPVEVVDGLKGEYLSKTAPNEPLVLVEDRAKHLGGLPPRGIGVLYNSKGETVAYNGPVIKSHDELWR